MVEQRHRPRLALQPPLEVGVRRELGAPGTSRRPCARGAGGAPSRRCPCRRAPISSRSSRSSPRSAGGISASSRQAGQSPRRPSGYVRRQRGQRRPSRERAHEVARSRCSPSPLRPRRSPPPPRARISRKRARARWSVGLELRRRHPAGGRRLRVRRRVPRAPKKRSTTSARPLRVPSSYSARSRPQRPLHQPQRPLASRTPPRAARAPPELPLRQGDVERARGGTPPPRFSAGLALVAVHEVVLERPQQVRAEAAPRRDRAAAGNRARSRCRKKPCAASSAAAGREALPPQEEVDGLPVRRAELLQRRPLRRRRRARAPRISVQRVVGTSGGGYASPPSP